MRTRLLPASVLLLGASLVGLTGCVAGPPGGPSAGSSAGATSGSVLGTGTGTGAGAGASAGVGSAAGDLAPDVAAALDELVAAGATAAVIDIRDGDEHSAGAAGSLGHDDSEAARPDSRLRIASVTKSMTATVILQLVDSGDLQLDTVVDDIVPGLLDSPAPVTVEQLLNHTSGVPDYFPVLAPTPAAYLAAVNTDYTTEDLVDAAQTLPWVAPPGERFSYANTNYAVLGRIAETVTGESLSSLLQSRIFEPLGMNDTSYPDSTALPERALRGVLDIDGAATDVGDAPVSLWNAAAAVTSTVGDVSTFFQALFGGRLVSAESLASMQAVGVEGYGLGLLAGGDACGVQPAELVYGQRGNGVGYRVLAFGSQGGDRFVTIGWTGGTFDPAADTLGQPGNLALVTALQSTCP